MAGNFIFSTSFATATGVASSSNSSFPAANVADYTHPYRPWKATNLSSGSTYAGLDLGGSTSVAAIVVDRVNVSSVRVSYGSSFPGTTLGTVTVNQDVWDGRYKLYIAAGVSARYWYVTANTSTSNDGQSVMSIGGIAALTSVTQWAVNPSGNVEFTPRTAVRLNDDFSSGAMEPVRLGNPTAEVVIASPVTPLTSQSDIGALVRIDSATPVVFYRNLSSTAEVYIAYLRGFTTTRQTGPNNLEMGQVIFREVV